MARATPALRLRPKQILNANPTIQIQRSRDGVLCFNWVAESQFDQGGRRRSFFAAGRTLGDVKRREAVR